MLAQDETEIKNGYNTYSLEKVEMSCPGGTSSDDVAQGVLTAYMTGGGTSDVFFGLKIYTLCIFGGSCNYCQYPSGMSCCTEIISIHTSWKVTGTSMGWGRGNPMSKDLKKVHLWMRDSVQLLLRIEFKFPRLGGKRGTVPIFFFFFFAKLWQITCPSL